MRLVRSPALAANLCLAARGPVVLVPTMGALHDGHRALLRQGRRLAGKRGLLVASLFVNPAQFGPAEDFSRYPRPLAVDRKVCAAEQVDLLFHPSAEAMYPAGFSTWVEEQSLSATLCGRTRPGHFRGVCTVVAKLFHLLQPDAALFGLKDFQQCAIVQKMVSDLQMPVAIVPVETVREMDGLALSSRNRFLSAVERAQAPQLRAALIAAAEVLDAGKTSAAARQAALRILKKTAPLARLGYLEIVDAVTLQPVPRGRAQVVVAAAVFFGKTRLIDNVWLR